jgi:alkylation response protein AidB-like acyl-CoA dehydrogenase
MLPTLDEGTDVLQQLTQVARSVVPRDPVQVRAYRDGAVGFDLALWQRFAELGWLGLLVPDEMDGAGAGVSAAAAVARTLGSAGRLEPFVACGVIVPACLAGLPATSEVQRLTRSVLAGELVAPAWSAAGWGSTAGRPVSVTAGPDGIVLSGTAYWVPVITSDVFLVLAYAEDEPVLVRVDATTPGLRPTPQAMADGTKWTHLGFEGGVRLPETAILARGQVASTALADALEAGAIVRASELLGSMERMVELTLDYLRNRHQFGKPIGSFQALQHKAVDVWVQLKLAEAAVDAAVQLPADASRASRSAAASGAKARTSKSALRIASDCVQMHGAIGFTDEYELGHHVNRSLVNAAWLGNGSAHTRRYSQLAAGGAVPEGAPEHWPVAASRNDEEVRR